MTMMSLSSEDKLIISVTFDAEHRDTSAVTLR